MFRTINIVLAALVLAGCVNRYEFDPVKFETCQVMERSLLPDISSGGGGSIFGTGLEAQISIDFANDVSEQNLNALQAMAANCRLWASGAATDEQFTKALLDHAGVYAAYRQIGELSADQQVLSDRVERLAKVFEETSLKLSPADIAQIRENAESIAALKQGVERSEQMIRSMQSQITTANDAYRKNFDSNEVALAERDSTIVGLKSDLGRVASEVEALNQDLESLSVTVAGLPPVQKIPPFLPIYFSTLEFELTAPAKKQIDDFLRIVPSVREFRVTGFADEQGREEGNVALSRTRAFEVSRYLESQGKVVVSENGQGNTDTFGVELPSNRVVLIEPVGP